MAFHAGEITGDLKLNLAPLQAGIKQAKTTITSFNGAMAASVKDAANGIQATTQATTGLGNSFKVAGDKFKKSGMKDAFELMRGAGIAAGFDYVGKALNKTFDTVLSVQKQVADGSLTLAQGISEGTVQFAKALPVVGEFTSLGQKIRDVFTGETESLNKLNAATAAYGDTLSAVAAARNTLAATMGATASLQQQMQRQMNLANAQTPGDAMRLTADFNFQDATKQLEIFEAQANKIRMDPNVSGPNRQALDQMVESLNNARLIAEVKHNIDIDQALKMDQKPIQQALESLQNQIDTFNLSDLQKQFVAFARIPKVGAESLDEFRRKLDVIRGQQSGKMLDDLKLELDMTGLTALEQRIASIRRDGLLNIDEVKQAVDLVRSIDTKSRINDALESIKSPMEKYQEQIAQLQGWFSSGAIDQSKFNLLSGKARRDFFGEDKLPKLYMAGSAESQALAYDQSRGVQAVGNDRSQQQLAEAKRTNDLLAMIGQYIRQQTENNKPIDIAF